mmetsp:Transcript_159467/g.487975  ORF Transcript_159467/g.487975 Transcript_159467/m.487975 type:complete len:201 (-) Transcript_159467:486-1088(-)
MPGTPGRAASPDSGVRRWPAAPARALHGPRRSPGARARAPPAAAPVPAADAPARPASWRAPPSGVPALPAGAQSPRAAARKAPQLAAPALHLVQGPLCLGGPGLRLRQPRLRGERLVLGLPDLLCHLAGTGFGGGLRKLGLRGLVLGPFRPSSHLLEESPGVLKLLRQLCRRGVLRYWRRRSSGMVDEGLDERRGCCTGL